MLESPQSICDRPRPWMCLTDLLQRSRARGAAFAHTTVHGDWGVGFPAGPRVSVHAIVAGEAHLWADAPADATRLAPGDIVLVRESQRHHMAHLPGAACIPFHDLPLDPSGRRRIVAGRRPADRFFCGAYDFEGDLCRPTLDALPPTFRLRPPPGSTLRATMDLLGREMLHDAPGQQALAGPAARRRAGAGPARALHRGGRERPGLVPRLRRPAPRRRAARDARRARAPVDGRPTLPPRRRCRARPSPGASPTSSGSGRWPI